MMTLDEARAHIGATVAYRSAGALAENGAITSVGNVAVFVRYEGDRYPKATDPADLTLITEAAQGSGNAEG
jgi:hypothetical protein